MNARFTAGNDSYEILGCVKGHPDIDLIRSDRTGLLYVRKVRPVYDLEVYSRLMQYPPVGVPRIQSIREVSGGLEIIEEYIQGETLQEIIETYGPLPKQAALDHLNRLCDILAPLHGGRPVIVHRDIKPSNIMLANDGQLYLLDFDAATEYAADKDEDTVLFGTHGYAAPEQYGFGASDPRADVYAIGRLAEMLFTGELTPAENYTGPYASVVKRCLSMDPSVRYKSAAELKRAFRHTIPLSPRLDFPGFRTRKPWKMVIAVIFYAFLTIGFIENIISNTGTRRTGDAIFYIDVLLTVLIIFNYRNWSIILPFSGSPDQRIRIVSRIFFTALIVFALQLLTGFLITDVFPG
ncbi:MAG: serine/threonine protein kinase [Firmicutes bacterium]|nr:serine/threonine protein kinase [Bacillota bacterium]